MGTGRILGSTNATWVSEVITVPYVATTVTQTVFIATQPMVVTDIRGRIRVVSTGACRISFYKVPSGTAVGSGTLLHAADSLAGGAFDLTSGTAGAVDTNQVINLTTTQAAITLAPGDGIGLLFTGTQTSAVGMVQITLEPA
jgi:hypothetical protein